MNKKKKSALVLCSDIIWIHRRKKKKIQLILLYEVYIVKLSGFHLIFFSLWFPRHWNAKRRLLSCFSFFFCIFNWKPSWIKLNQLISEDISCFIFSVQYPINFKTKIKFLMFISVFLFLFLHKFGFNSYTWSKTGESTVKQDSSYNATDIQT